MRYEISINGLDHAYRREWGCSCARCLEVRPNANTSVSLLGFEAQMLAFHALIDAGGGVTDSLLANPDLRLEPRLDWVWLTHWHPDHVSELQRIAISLWRALQRRQRSASQPRLWMREGSRMWLERQQPHALAAFEVISSLEYLPAGNLLEPLPLGLPDLEVTPITLAHSSADLFPPHGEEKLPCCAGFILQTAGHKTALLWDLDATNLWLEQRSGKSFELLHGCQNLFIDSNTWSYQVQPNGLPTSHSSFALIKRFAGVLEPHNTYLVHISGHEDAIGDGFGWSNEIWQLEAQKAWREAGLHGQVFVPSIGQRIALVPQQVLSAFGD
ncbi:MAG: MBL fold metallo-hydrolase [Deinococcales bacterium]